MKQRIGQSGVTTEDLQLYFDNELSGAEARELAAQIEAEPELKAELEQLGLLQGLVSQGMTAMATEVPEARFEQIWDEIDRTIDRDARQQDAGAGQPSLWNRLRSAFRPWRVPVAAALGAAAAVVVVMNVGDGETQTDPGANNSPVVASEDRDADPEPKGSTAPQPTPPDKVVQAPGPDTSEATDAFPVPKAVEAEIHEVEFGGKNGRISRGGTVTVLYVEEDVEPKDSERSL